MKFTLPMPPSVNGMFATDFKTKRRFISKEYASWKKKADVEFRSQWGAYGIPAPYGVHIRLNLDHRSDVDNRCKPILDLLVHLDVIEGDQWVNTIRIDRDRTIPGCTVEVWTIEDSANEARPIGEIIKPMMARIAERIEP